MATKRGQQVERLLSITKLAEVLGRHRTTTYRLVMRQLLDTPPIPSRPWAVRHGRSWRIKLSAWKATFVEYKDEAYDHAEVADTIERLAEQLGEARRGIDCILPTIIQRTRSDDDRIARLMAFVEKRDKANAKVVSELRAEVRKLRAAWKRRRAAR